MTKKNIILISILCLLPGIGFANANTHQFSFQNKSKHSIYVWVAAASDVLVPGVTNAFPAQVLSINPGTTGQLNYTYTQVWNEKQTELVLKFCTTPSQSCVNTVGEYSAFAMVPDLGLSNTWTIKDVWSGIVFPYSVSDNIYTFNNVKWSRERSFPQVIQFKEK